MLTWVALWSPAAWERIDDLLVLVPGSIAVLCAVTLTLESVYVRVSVIFRSVRTAPLGIAVVDDDDNEDDEDDD